MSRALRFVAVVSAALLGCGSAVAQPQLAPAPHLPLSELAKEYKRLGLPLPPKEAELVRITGSSHIGQLGFRLYGSYPEQLGLLASVPPGGYPHYLIGAGYTWQPDRIEPIKPGADAVRDIEPRWVVDAIGLAVQCRERGWDEFAELLYARAREAIANPVPARWRIYERDEGNIRVIERTPFDGWKLRTPGGSALDELRQAAVIYWTGQIRERDSDRNEILRHLKELAPGQKDNLRVLELTVAPRRSKPGTPEAFIDELTEYWESDKRAFEPLDASQRGEAAYRKLVEMGFDAVPALLDHLKDERLTRHRHVQDIRRPGSFPVLDPIEFDRVGHIVGRILNELSGREFAEKYGGWIDAKKDGYWIDAKKARAWWEKAQKDGEEKWLVAHVTPEPDVNLAGMPPANEVIFRALGVKYPARLGEFYRTLLDKQPERGSRLLADAVAASNLPREKKLAVLGEAATHDQLTHRATALDALAGLNQEAFRKHLAATLKWLPPKVEQIDYCPETWLIDLVVRSNDPACWEALTDASRRSPVGRRIEIISATRWFDLSGNKLMRRELLQFLLRFLSDESEDRFTDGRLHKRVQDVATAALAKQLKIDIESDDDNDRGPVTRLILRAAVAKAAAEELARLKK